MIQLMWLQAYAMATSVVRRAQRDERGDVSEKTVTIAVMVALALAAGAVITAAVMAKMGSITFN
ncbi:MAG: hypothetical protein QOD63_1717 [Actinomycetota bacterium]|nr:hypothetical protein [Actinomycetota bacterium]